MTEINAGDVSSAALRLLSGGRGAAPAAASLGGAAPRTTGGFAATGASAPLTFESISEGLLLVRERRAPEALLSSRLGSSNSAKAAGGAGGGLLAALSKDKDAQKSAGAQGPMSEAQPGGGGAAASPAPSVAARFSCLFVKQSEAEQVPLEQQQHLARNMMRVTAVDAVQRKIACVLADGTTHVTISRLSHGGPQEDEHMRRAGRLETALFERWRQSPGELRALLAAAPADATAAAGTKRGRDDAGAVTVSGLAEFHGQPQRRVWWVVAGLIVRYAPEEHDATAPVAYTAHIGSRCVVESINKREDRIVLRRLPSEPDISAAANSSAGPLVLCVSQAHVQTVVPRAGVRGMVVGGPRSGEFVVVQDRVRDPTTGDMTVRAVCDGTLESFSADEICQWKD